VANGSSTVTARDRQDAVRTGIPGLDEILRGGLSPHRMYVVEGDPGAGKTTLALQFLLEGVRSGETVLYVTLSETSEELQEVAESHEWTLDGVNLLELGALAGRLRHEAEYTVYHPADVELGEMIKRIRAEADRLQPTRVVLDSLSELKVLSETNARYRREILGLKQFFAGKHCTVLVLDDRTGRQELQLQSIAHGVIGMERERREYGDTRRQIQIVKMRGVGFRDGRHDFVIKTGGLAVYPRLSAAEHDKNYPRESVKSGVQELDALLGGGLDRGTSTLVMGPAGCGKTTLSSQFLIAALRRGDSVECFLFEESISTFLERATGLGLDFEPFIASGLCAMHQIDPAELSPGEFAHQVQQAVEQRDIRVLMIDSLNGYLNAMPSEQFLMIQMHELLMFLGKQGVVTILVMAQHGMMGTAMQSPVDVSFLADTVVLLRYFEAMGEVRQAISVVKKRRSSHERTIREMRLGPGGVIVGEPLRQFQGVLTGVPRYEGNDKPLLKKQNGTDENATPSRS
jgi:circadian clock protein KaiC